MNKKINQERMEALYFLIKSFEINRCVNGVDKFLTDRKLNPLIPIHSQNIKELSRAIKK